MNKCRGLITSIRKSRLLYEEVLRIARAASVEDGLILDMKIRWNSTFKMIHRLLIYRKLIGLFCDTLDSLEEINNKQKQTLIKLKLSGVEWNIMQVLHHVLERFYVATKVFSGHIYPTLSLAYAVIYSLSHYLNSRSMNSAHATENIIKEMLLEAFNKYWVDAKVSADFFSFLCFKFLLKQNTINQQRIYHCYL